MPQDYSRMTPNTLFAKVLMTMMVILCLASCKKPVYYNISTSVQPVGSGSIVATPSSASVLEGTSVTFKASPNGDYVFTGWSGSLSGTDNPATVVASSDLSIIANFRLREYPLTLAVEGEGSIQERVVSTKTDYPSGTVVELTAMAAEHWLFDHWEGDVTSKENPTQIIISAAKDVKAVFVKKMYDLTVIVEGEGAVQEKVVETKGSYQEGTLVELTAITNEFWAFDHWEGAVEGKDNPITLTVIGESKVRAVFVENDPGIHFTEASYVSPQDVFDRLGLGFNLGCHLNGFLPDGSGASIPDWVNEVTINEMMDKIVAMGAKSVRLQTTFSGELGVAPDYHINDDWMAKIDLYVNACERRGLNVILDVMHEASNPSFSVDFEGASHDPSIYEYERTRNNAIWLQLARHYRDRGEFLIFEPFNEPCTLDNNHSYPDVLNKLNQEFVKVVRSTGGNNATRWISIPGWWCNAEDALSTLILPEDYVSNNRTIVPFHYYAGLFNNENWTEWGHTATLTNPDIWNHGEDYVNALFNRMKECFIDNGIPVILGETGCLSGVNDRQCAYEMYYLEYSFRCASLNLISPFLHFTDGPVYAEDGSGIVSEDGNYGFYDFSKKKYRLHGKEIENILNNAVYNKDSNYTLDSIYQNAPFQDELPLVPIYDEDLAFVLLNNYDRNQDGKLTYDEIMQITSLDLSDYGFTTIEDFGVLPALCDLSCYGPEDNPGPLERVDVSDIVELRHLNIGWNQVEQLVMDNIKLQSLICNSNLLSTLDLSHTPSISSLNCGGNPIKELNLSQLDKLDWLDCCCMQITKLGLSENPLLRELRCHTNPLKELDLSNNPKLAVLDCYSTSIAELDVSNNLELNVLHLWDCPQLAVIYLKDGQHIPDLIIDEHTQIVYKK